MAHEVSESRGRLAGRALETLSLFVLLTVIGLRPLIGESYDLAGLAMTSVWADLTDPLPLHTLLLDIAILAATFAWALAKGLQPQRYRWCGLEVGLALVVIAAVISCTVANDQRAAINASVDWVSMAVIAVMLTQLLRERRDVRLALCIILASAAAQAYQCFNQKITLPETQRVYQEQREAFWEAQGVPLDSSRVLSFERRIAAGEASGYFSHSNIAGAYLVLTFFVALGVAAGCWGRLSAASDWISRLAVSLVAVFVFAALLLTHSLGAMVACAGGFAVGVARHWARTWIESRRGLTLLLGWALVIGGGLAVVAHGCSHGSLPGASLNFRWGYWTAAAKLIADHPWTGVGRENFRDAGLKYKTIAEPEEVENPHNFLVTAAAEWGVLGLLGVLAMVVGASIAVTHPLPRALVEAEGTKHALPPADPLWRWMLLLMLSVFGFRLLLLGSDNPHYLFVVTVEPAIIWVAAFVVCALGADPWERSGRDGWLRMALLINCGLFAFLLQDTINFATIVPGTVTTCFALVGVAVAARRVPAPSREPAAEDVPDKWPWSFAVVVGLALAVVAGFVVPPVWRATGLVAQARASRTGAGREPIEHHPANVFYREALKADPWDPTAAAERAEWLRRLAGSTADPVPTLREALESIEEAIARCPLHVSYHRRRAAILHTLAELTDDPRARAGALESARRVLDLYPTRPASYVDLADLQAWAGQKAEQADLVEAAVANYQRALELDGQRPAWEEIRRFRPATLKEIESKLANACAWLAVRENASTSQSDDKLRPGGS